MTTRWTPLQRTRRKHCAAERDAPMPSHRSVTRLAEQPARRLCVVAGWGAVPSRLTLEVGRCAHCTLTGPGRHRAGQCLAAGPGSIAARSNITAPSAILPQSLASSLGGSSAPPAAARPAGSQKGRLCLAPLRGGARSRFAALLQRPACALALSRQREGLARRCAQRWRGAPAHPGPSAARACGPAGLRSRARSRPSRPPRKRGSPKFNGNPGPWGESSRRLPKEHSAVLAASRVRFAAARP